MENKTVFLVLISALILSALGIGWSSVSTQAIWKRSGTAVELVYSGDDVGIGAAPGDKLRIEGNIRLPNDGIIWNSAANAGIKLSNGVLKFFDGAFGGPPSAYLSGKNLTVMGNSSAEKFIETQAGTNWTSGYLKNTAYQANSSGTVTAYCDSTTSESIYGFTNDVNPPTQRVISQVVTGNAGSVSVGISFPVRKNDWWNITGSGGTPVILWLSDE